MAPLLPKSLLHITVMRKSGAWGKSVPGYRAKTLQWCEAALKGLGKGAVSVVFADDAFVQDLNHHYRGKNKPTNVLSFPSDAKGELGDIVLAYETIRQEAKAQKKTMTRHTAHLVIHGCLHLAGFDHEKQQEAERMESREIKILSHFNIPNPYEATHGAA